MKRYWLEPKPEVKDAIEVSRVLGVSPIIVDILGQRGLKDIEGIVEFLRPSLLNVPSPFLFKDMRRAINRLEQAIINNEKILIYGDYDVDGVTSCTLLFKVFTDLGFKAVTYIPHRQEEGYGLHQEVIMKAHESGVKVLVTVDCGITAVPEVEIARDLGIDVIVTDHHEPLERLPEALAIINPKADPEYPFRDLAGVGVAYKLAQALIETFGEKGVSLEAEIELLDLVALGTIADVVPLIGENRIYVFYGLKQMSNTVHIGLRALLEECGLIDKKIKAGQVAFMVAPRINAAGRMDSARICLELLLSEDIDKARELARFLSKENLSRQETEKVILAQAIEQIEKTEIPRVIVLSGKGWHHGVIGIVASRLVERYFRPVFLIAEEENEAKGSARGIPGYHVLEQLKTQAHILEKFGGHKQAAGFSLSPEKIPLLREGLNSFASLLPEEAFIESLVVDRILDIDEIDEQLLIELDALAPYGFGNPSPIFAGKSLPIKNIMTVGKDNSHLKIMLNNSTKCLDGMAFRQGQRLSELTGNENLDMVFTLDWNNFQGRQELQLLVKDIQVTANWKLNSLRKVAEFSTLTNNKSNIFESLKEINEGFREISANLELDEVKVLQEILGVTDSRINKLSPVETVKNMDLENVFNFVSRDELIEVYQILRELHKKSNPFCWTPREKKDYRALKIFEELGIISCLGGHEIIKVKWLRLEKKLELDSSLSYRTSRLRYERAKEIRTRIC